MIGKTPLLDQMARGVSALSDSGNSGTSIPPYPGEMQYALDLVVYECVRHELTPPTGVPELIQWCTDLSGKQWPFEAESRLEGLSLVTSVHRIRTRACAELAGLATVASDLLLDVLADVPDAATRLQFLRSQVLLGTNSYRELLMQNPAIARTYRFVKHLYQPAPAEWVTHGKVALCECGLPAKLASDDDWLTEWCERETCPPGTAAQLHPAAKALLLHPALRLFLALPQQLEGRLRCGLESVGQAHGGDEVRFPGSPSRSFRCYDRVVPEVLAHDAAADRIDIAVIPDDSAIAGPDARCAFADAIPIGTDITLVTESELLAQVNTSGRALDA